MATKVDHEKPEVMEEPIVKKVRLDEQQVTENVKKVTIEETINTTAIDGDTTITTETVVTTEKNIVEGDEDKIDDQQQSTEPIAVEKKENEKEVTGTVAVKDTGEEGNELSTDDTVEETTKPNTTGSAFGGFSAFSNSSGFGGFTSSSSNSGFGTTASSSSTFGNTSSGFGGFASFQNSATASFSSFAAQPSTGFKDTTTQSDLAEIDATIDKKTEQLVPALTEAELANGEEGERILVEKRAKLYKLVDNDYAEVGIGPLRVLQAKQVDSNEKASTRIVMRRESYPRGPGTKLLLNTRLASCLTCVKKTDKAMLLTVVETSEDNEQKITPITYLIRFGSPLDFELVLMKIQPYVPSMA